MSRNELNFSVLDVSTREKDLPVFLESPAGEEKLPYRVTNEFWTLGFEKSERGGVCFQANPTVIEDHNSVERAIEDGLELAFGRIENTRGFVVRAARKGQETDVKGDCQA